jgi:hypothetical protein
MTDLSPPPSPRRRYDADLWDQARSLYQQGHTAETVCARLGLGQTAFWRRARKGCWRRVDVPAGPAPDPYDPQAPVPDRAALMADAWKRAAHAQAQGRVAEALRWMRHHAAMADAARAEDREIDRQSAERMRAMTRSARGVEAEALAALQQVRNERRARVLSRAVAADELAALTQVMQRVEARAGYEAAKGREGQSKSDSSPLNRAERRRAERAARRPGAAATLPP